MKKRLFLLLASAVLLGCFGADLRLDVRGLPEKGTVKPLSAGCTVSVVVRGLGCFTATVLFVLLSTNLFLNIEKAIKMLSC